MRRPLSAKRTITIRPQACLRAAAALAILLLIVRSAAGNGVGANSSCHPDVKLCPLEEQLFDDAADGRLDEFSLLDAALVASGVEQLDVLRRYQEQRNELLEKLLEDDRFAGSSRDKAEAVFEFMHQHILSGGYRIDGTDVREALDHGRFNCVSASVLFNCLAGEVGLTVCGLEAPGHAMSRVNLAGGPLDLETTCPDWFRWKDDPKRQAQLVEETLGRDSAEDRLQAREISAVQMVAMIYYNRGVDLLNEKQFELAAAANAKAVRMDPSSKTAWGNLLATINNWAIERGSSDRYAEAAELLHRGLALDPDYETFAINYMHVYNQWVEQLCEAGQFEKALTLLDRAATERPDRQYFQQAPLDVYRRWAETRLDHGETDRALEVFSRARQRYGDSREVLEAEAAAVNAYGVALLEQGRLEEALAVFDRGLARQPGAKPLAENRRVAIMRWAKPAFDRGDYAEAIRRTTAGATPGGLHASLVNNVRFGYHRWISSLKAAGHRRQARQISRRAKEDPFLP